MTKENDQYGQDSGELPCRSDFIVILVGTTITAFCVWVINSYESAQQGYKWVVLGLVTLFSGGAVLGTILKIIEYYFKNRISYRFKESLPIIFWSLILNGIGVFRLYESFERPDANNDGLFTITDIGVHAKETFFATGDRFTVWIANTSVG